MRKLTALFAVATLFISAAATASAQTCTIDGSGWSDPSVGTWDSGTKTATLTQDLNDGIIIAASGITLDGAGYTIQAPSAGLGTGVRVNVGLSGVKILNLKITDFSFGIYLFGDNVDCVLADGEMTGMAAYGVALNPGCHRTKILRNRIGLCGGGMYPAGSNALEIVGNTVNEVQEYGFRVYGGDDVVVRDNSITAAAGAHSGVRGIRLEAGVTGSRGAVLENNTTNDCTGGINVIDAQDVTIRANTANDNTGSGIGTQGSSLLVFENNTANGNGLYGILIQNPGGLPAITGNTALDNGQANGAGAAIGAGPLDHCVISGNRTRGARVGLAVSGPGLEIRGNTAEGHAEGLRLETNDATVEDNEIRDCSSYCIRITGDRNALRRNTVTASGYQGIQVIGSGCTLVENHSTGFTYGIRIDGGSDHTLTRNEVTDSAEAGIYLSSVASSTVEANVATGNRRGIQVGGTDNTLTGNTATGNETGIDAGVAVRSTFRGNDLSNNTKNGMFLSAANESTIENNELSGNGGQGLLVKGERNRITGNTANGNTGGIYLAGPGSGNVVEGNTANDNAQTGIRLSQVPGSELRGNTFNGNGQFGIQLDGSPDCVVAGNTISDTGGPGDGVRVESSDRTVIGPGNMITGGIIGVNLGGVDGVKVLQNTVRDAAKCGVICRGSTNAVLRENDVDGNANGIIIPTSASGCTVENNHADGCSEAGLWLEGSGHIARANVLTGCGTGILLNLANGNTVEDNEVSGNLGDGFRFLGAPTGNVIRRNLVKNNGGFGLNLYSASGNTIVDNDLLNTQNVSVTGGTGNTWNVPLAPGMNIVGGPKLGGNYWANPTGTGFSEVTPDANTDGICDSPFVIDAQNVDQFPLGGIPGLVIDPASSQDTMWPPDHTMVEITVDVNATNPLTAIDVAITSSEGENEHEPDWEVLGTDPESGTVSLNLRRERDGDGPGRTYTISITVTDVYGQTATASVTVTVPHDQDD